MKKNKVIKKRPVFEKITNFLFEKEIFIFSNSTLSENFPDIAVNDLLYNLVKSKLLEKLGRGIYLHPMILENLLNNYNKRLYFPFILTHQSPDWYLSGMSAINYILGKEEKEYLLYSLKNPEFSWREEGFSFEVRKSVWGEKISHFIYKLKVDKYNFKLADPVLILFDLLSMDTDIYQFEEVVIAFLKKESFRIKKSFFSFIDILSAKELERIKEKLLYFLEHWKLGDIYKIESHFLKYGIKGTEPKELEESDWIKHFDFSDKKFPLIPYEKGIFSFLKKKINLDQLGEYGANIFFAPAGFFKDELLYFVYKNFPHTVSFWYNFDSSDYDWKVFTHNFISLIGETFPEIWEGYRRISPFLPQSGELSVELFYRYLIGKLKRYTLSSKIAFFFNYTENVKDSFSWKFLIRFCQHKLENLQVFVLADSTFFYNYRLLFSSRVNVYDISYLLFDHNTLRSYLKEQMHYTFDYDQLDEMMVMTWGIPQFVIIFSQIVSPERLKQNLDKELQNNRFIRNFIINYLFKPYFEKLKTLISFLVVVEKVNFQILNSFLAYMDEKVDLTYFLTAFSGYVRWDKEVVVNPLVANVFRKIITTQHDSFYRNFILKTIEFIEKENLRDYYLPILRELFYLNVGELVIFFLKKWGDYILKSGRKNDFYELLQKFISRKDIFNLEEQLYIYIYLAQVDNISGNFEHGIKIIKNIKNYQIKDVELKRKYFFVAALLYRNVKRHQQALSYLQKVKELDERNYMVDESKKGDVYLAEAILWEKRGDYQKASLAYMRAYRYFLKSDDVRKQSYVINNMAVKNLRQGDFYKAKRLYQKAENLALLEGDRFALGNIYYNMALLHFYNGEQFWAFNYLEKSYNLFKDFSDEKQIFEVLFIMAYFCLQTNNFFYANWFRDILSKEAEKLKSPNLKKQFQLFVFKLECYQDNMIKAEKIYRDLEQVESLEDRLLVTLLLASPEGLKKEVENVLKQELLWENTDIPIYRMVGYRLLALGFWMQVGKLSAKWKKELIATLKLAIEKGYFYWNWKFLSPVYQFLYEELMRIDKKSTLWGIEYTKVSRYLNTLLAGISWSDIYEPLWIKTRNLSRFVRVLTVRYETFIEKSNLQLLEKEKKNFEYYFNFAEDKFYSAYKGEISLVRGTILYKLLKVLLENIKYGISSWELYKKVWEIEPDEEYMNNLKVSVSNLQKIFGKDRRRLFVAKRKNEDLYYYFNWRVEFCLIQDEII